MSIQYLKNNNNITTKSNNNYNTEHLDIGTHFMKII